MRQKEIVLLNLRKEDRSLENELQFGLRIYISLIVSIVFFVPGLFLTFYAFGMGDVFKTDNNQVKIPFLILSIFCYMPMIIWFVIVFCPRKEVRFLIYTCIFDHFSEIVHILSFDSFHWIGSFSDVQEMLEIWTKKSVFYFLFLFYKFL